MENIDSVSSLLRHKPQNINRIQYMMGCFVEIEIKKTPQSNQAMDKAFNEMKRIEHLLSRFSNDSLTSDLNRFARISPISVSSEMFSLIKKCIFFSKLTQGAFDLAAAPLTHLWETATKNKKNPTDSEIKSTLAGSNYQHLILDERNLTVFFNHPNTQIDFGAIGKGYAVECAMDILKSHGIEDALISTGSNISLIGSEASSFGIKDPHDDENILDEMTLHNNSLSTSAAYERFYEINGKKYGHVISPLTGFPVENNLLSVTVAGSDATTCDILSTAIYVLGEKKGIELTHNLPGFNTKIIKV